MWLYIKVSYETWDSIFEDNDVNMIFFSQYIFKDILFLFPSKKTEYQNSK